MKKSSGFYYKVAPKAPLFKTFTYKSATALERGQRAKIPFGSKKINGFILEEQNQLDCPASKIKEILEIDESSRPLDSARLSWLEWMSRYYYYPLGLVLDTTNSFRPLRQRPP